jgi:hypothetical protein
MLELKSQPDQVQRDRPEPDFVYGDAKSGMAVAIEVTRAGFLQTRFLDRQLAELGEEIRAALTRGTGSYIIFLPVRWPLLKARGEEGAARRQLVASLSRALCEQSRHLPPSSKTSSWQTRFAEAHFMGLNVPEGQWGALTKQRVDLSDVFCAGACAVRYDDAREDICIVRVADPCWTDQEKDEQLDQLVEVARTEYAKILKEAATKLTRYASNRYETFLLLDARLDSLPLFLNSEQLSEWHRFSSAARAVVHHVILFRLEGGLDHDDWKVRATSLWNRPDAALQVQPEWAIQPFPIQSERSQG